MIKKIIASAVLLSLVVTGILVSLNKAGFIGNDEVKELQAIEVTEYEGANLSSISKFRENSIKGPQYVAIENYQLSVTGLVAQPLSYTYDKVTDKYEHYQKVVRLNCVEGWSVDILWEGMLVRDLLAEARPLTEAKTVIFHAYDGYTTSFPIEYVTNSDIIMAYKMNEVVIPPERGFPFQLVAESKWGYKRIKRISHIELDNHIHYKSHWEIRGYSNEGDLDKSFFDVVK